MLSSVASPAMGKQTETVIIPDTKNLSPKDLLFIGFAPYFAYMLRTGMEKQEHSAKDGADSMGTSTICREWIWENGK